MIQKKFVLEDFENDDVEDWGVKKSPAHSYTTRKE